MTMEATTAPLQAPTHAKLGSGLLCPHCNGVVAVPEGSRVLYCPHCGEALFLQGEQGIRRWQIGAKIDRQMAVSAVERFFDGLDMALTLKRQAELGETFLIFQPYWRVRATVAGWIFGWKKKGKDQRHPVEVEIFEEMHWADAATDVSEFGVHRVSVAHEELVPYDGEQLYASGMVFEPTESGDAAVEEAAQYFADRSRRRSRLADFSSDLFYLLRRQLSIIYYPLWVVRYKYRRRHYQVVVDGVRGDVLYGKAPGNIWYRALALVGTMALGNFILVNGTALALAVVFAAADASSDLDALCALPLIPLAFGIGLVVAGYRKFRFGAEVEHRRESAERALDEGKVRRGNVSIGERHLQFDLWAATDQAQAMWVEPRTFYVPAGDLPLARVRQLGYKLLFQQPVLTATSEPPPGARMEPASSNAEDAAYLAEFLVLDVEAKREDMLRRIEFEIAFEHSELWAFPQRRNRLFI